MKAGILLLLSFSFFVTSSFSQVTARRITEKVVPQEQRNRPQQPPAPPSQAPTQGGQNPGTKPVAPVVREKTKEEKAEMEKKTIEFQTQRARQGSASSQYDLGMRFLTGNGVEKNEETARKWLNAAAQQGHTTAAKKIQELDKK